MAGSIISARHIIPYYIAYFFQEYKVSIAWKYKGFLHVSVSHKKKGINKMRRSFSAILKIQQWQVHGLHSKCFLTGTQRNAVAVEHKRVCIQPCSSHLKKKKLSIKKNHKRHFTSCKMWSIRWKLSECKLFIPPEFSHLFSSHVFSKGASLAIQRMSGAPG